MANPTASTLGSSGSNDMISNSMTHIATTASKQRKLVAVCSVIAVAAIFAGSLYVSKRNAFRSVGNEALFKARKTLTTEMKAVADALKPPAKPEDKNAKKDPKKPAKAEPAAPNVEFTKFNVDEKLKGGVAALQKVSEDYSATMAGFDAEMQLGGLYFDHATDNSSYEKAAMWFEKASNGAPSSEQASTALYGLGYAQEALGKCADAVKTFDRAMNSGGSTILGDLLRAQGRCYETLGDKANARKAYERLEKSFPGTDDAKFATHKLSTL